MTVSGSIQNILDSQNATGRVAGPSGENTHTMEVSAQYNEEALNNKISNLSCISGGSIVTTKMLPSLLMKKEKNLPSFRLYREMMWTRKRQNR